MGRQPSHVRGYVRAGRLARAAYRRGHDSGRELARVSVMIPKSGKRFSEGSCSDLKRVEPLDRYVPGAGHELEHVDLLERQLRRNAVPRVGLDRGNGPDSYGRERDDDESDGLDGVHMILPDPRIALALVAAGRGRFKAASHDQARLRASMTARARPTSPQPGTDPIRWRMRVAQEDLERC